MVPDKHRLPTCVFSCSNWSFSFTVEDCIGMLDSSAGHRRLRCPRHGPINLGFDRNSADLTAIAPDVVRDGQPLLSSTANIQAFLSLGFPGVYGFSLTLGQLLTPAFSVDCSPEQLGVVPNGLAQGCLLSSTPHLHAHCFQF